MCERERASEREKASERERARARARASERERERAREREITVCKSPCGFSLDISMKMPAALGTLRERKGVQKGLGLRVGFRA